MNGAGACASASDPGERALCHAYLAEADCALKKAGAPRDRCLFERAIAGTSTFACALIEGSTGGVEKELAWEDQRFSRALGFVFSALDGGAWVDGRWSDEYLVVERHRNCLIAVMTHVDYDAPPLKAPDPPPLSAIVDAGTESVIEVAKAIIDEHLE